MNIPFYRIKHIIVVPFIYTATRYHPTVSLPDCGLNGGCLYFVGLESCQMLNTLRLVQAHKDVCWLSRFNGAATAINQ